jgi:hypothetical protein
MATSAETGAETGSNKGPDKRPATARGRLWLALLVVACVVIGLPLALAGGVWLRLGAGPLALPAPLTARIEARLDAAMSANRVTLDRVEVNRPEGAELLTLRLIDVRLAHTDGTLRAAFPSVAVALSPRSLVRGEVHPLRVDLAGAGLRLNRDADGRIDLVLTAGAEAHALSVMDTLARLDTMFASPVFSELEGVTASGLQLAMADAMTGQVIRAREARMRLNRKDGVLTLTLGGALEGSRDATIDLALTRSAASGVTNVGFAFTNLAARDVATMGPAVAWLDLMRAPISGFMGGALNDDGSVGDLRATLDIGPGEVRLEGAPVPLRFERLASAMHYEAATGRLSFDSFALDAPVLALNATGHADVSPDGSRYTAQFELADIRFAQTDLFPEPLMLDGAAVDLRLTLAPRLLIEIGQAVIHDDGIEVRAHGRIAAQEAGLDIALDAQLPQADAGRLLSYWPTSAIPRTRAWIAERLAAGQVHGVDFALRADAGAAPRHALSFDFDGLSLSALPSLPPIEGGAGYLSLTGPRLIIRLDEGQITAPSGVPVALDGSQLVVDDTRQRGPRAEIDIAIAGDLTDALTLLTEPPVRLFANGTMTPARIGNGAINASGRITTRLMRQEGLGDTRFAFTGEVTGFASETLVPGRSLSADRVQVAVDNDALRLSGRALFDGVPLTGQWSRALGPGAERVSRVEARARLTRARLAALGLTLPDWMLSGETVAMLDLTLPDGAAPVLRVTSDLAGARLALPPLGWALGIEQTGRLETEIVLGADPTVSRLSLEAGGLSLSGRASLAPGGGLDRLTADQFRLDNWLNVTGALIGRGGRAPAIEITGGTLDLRGAPQTGGGRAGGGGPITATLDRLQVTEGIALTALRAELTSDGGLSGQFRGRVNGEAPVTGTLVSTAVGPAVRLRAEDGGAVLRAAGLFRTAFGGAMELVLQATGAEGTYDGTLSIDSPRLRDAPVMAELLNLISVVGLLEQLSGDGINLGEVDASFRLTPTRLILAEGTAVGPSLGVSMDGTYTLATRELDMQGVISPLYIVNGLVGALFAPRGEGLFGFSYSLTGRSENPQVFVNPLSILTPGVFREIFRRPPPDLTGN